MAGPANYQVLARKYRPQRFEDLVGQDALVRTLTNAFALGRIAHAFMLTGVRGVGKTTTARLIARALNYQTDTVDAPQIALDPPGAHCPAIAASRHPDVMEMDAASRTGVGDIREILDGVRYAPVSARIKVYIIDEVHMLSTSAFNALLKTLEEPPPHVKFVFATTEIRKVPVTVLSRCQRFDLRRVAPDVLLGHLTRICAAEGVAVAPDALQLIVRAAEGSVRDALSLLDQALVQGDAVEAAVVRDMLGLADRGLTLDLFAHVLGGEGAPASRLFHDMAARGADGAVVVRDLLDHCHDVTRAKALGAEAGFADAADHVARVRTLAEVAGMGALTRLWQMLLKAHEEVRAAPDPAAAAEMAILRLAYAASLPPPEAALGLISGPAGGAPLAASTAPASPTRPVPATAAAPPAERSAPWVASAGPGATLGSAPLARAPDAGLSRGATHGATALAADRFAAPAPAPAPTPWTARIAPAPEFAPAPEPVLAPAPAEPYPDPGLDAEDDPPPAPAPIDPDDPFAVPLDAYADDTPWELGDLDGPTSAQAPPQDAPRAPARLVTLEDVSDLCAARRDLNLKYDLDTYARPVRIERGRIVYAPAPGAPETLAPRLSRALEAWTGERWLVAVDAREPGGETVRALRERRRAEELAEVARHPVVAALLARFPGAEIVAIEPAPIEETPR